MKNQYFGDINDYQKYGLLRCLSQAGLKIGLCWMLTPNDSSGDGGYIGYTQNPSRYRDHDPEVFTALHTALSYGTRHTSLAAQLGILPGALYFPDLLTDQAYQRSDYFSHLFKTLKTVDLIFFDPDNGLEVPPQNMTGAALPNTSTGTKSATPTTLASACSSTSISPASSGPSLFKG